MPHKLSTSGSGFSNRKIVILRAVFLTGALIDGLIALEWYIISLGLVDMPIHPSFFQGSGQDYRFVLSIAALFMAGWALLLFWGSLQPVTRSGETDHQLRKERTFSTARRLCAANRARAARDSDEASRWLDSRGGLAACVEPVGRERRCADRHGALSSRQRV